MGADPEASCFLGSHPSSPQLWRVPRAAWCCLLTMWVQEWAVSRPQPSALPPGYVSPPTPALKLEKLESTLAELRAHFQACCRAVLVSSAWFAPGAEKHLPLCDHGRVPRRTNLPLAGLHPSTSVCICRRAEKATDVEDLDSVPLGKKRVRSRSNCPTPQEGCPRRLSLPVPTAPTG